jgi:hypothetical protein
MLCFTFDRLDAVVLEERIAEARRVPSGYRCLALLHRAEAAVPREAITIFAAIFTGAHRSWRKQSIQCNRCDQCRRADGLAFNTVVVVIRSPFHLACVAYHLTHVQSFSTTMLWRMVMLRRQGKSPLAMESINGRYCRSPP